MERVQRLLPYFLNMETGIGPRVRHKPNEGLRYSLTIQETILISLHSGSMQAMQVIIKPYKTFRFNLAICKQFNSDFDGKISYCRQQGA